MFLTRKMFNNFFILCLISSHPALWEFFLFCFYSTVFPKYVEERFLGENINFFRVDFLYISLSWCLKKLLIDLTKIIHFQSCSFYYFASSESSLMKYNKIYLKTFHFSKYQKSIFLENMITLFLILGLESSISQNTRKNVFFRKYKKFVKSGFFYFLSLSWKVRHVTLLITALSVSKKMDLTVNLNITITELTDFVVI